jgi:hypothetical protein
MPETTLLERPPAEQVQMQWCHVGSPTDGQTWAGSRRVDCAAVAP